eukprot:4457202-Amphidinium_carterae.1
MGTESGLSEVKNVNLAELFPWSQSHTFATAAHAENTAVHIPSRAPRADATEIHSLFAEPQERED